MDKTISVRYIVGIIISCLIIILGFFTADIFKLVSLILIVAGTLIAAIMIMIEYIDISYKKEEK